MKCYLPVVLLGLVFSSTAFAYEGGYTGPTGSPLITKVANAHKAHDDANVILEGRIVKRLKGENYEFHDASGIITVEIDHDLWPAAAVSDRARVRLYGEVDREMFSRTIDVDRLEVLN